MKAIKTSLINVLALVLFVVCIFGLHANAQTDPNPKLNVATGGNSQFQLNAKVVSLSTASGTVPATDLGAMFAVSKNFSLRSDNIVSDGSGQGFFGGAQYFLSSNKILTKTNFDPATFQFYLTASGGYVLFGDHKHAGWLAGGGVNYDPTHSGKFSVNVFELRAARMPYIAVGVVPVLSTGVSLGW